MNGFSRFYTKKKFDLVLLIVAIFCLWMMIAASSDPVISFLQHSKIEKLFTQFKTGNSIIFNLSVGSLSAIGMFYLLVRLPEYEQKNRMKRHLKASYLSFKTSIIQIFVGSVNGSYNTDIIDQLMETKNFKEFFKEPYSKDQNKWDRLANKMDDFILRQIILETEVLYNEFQHIISVVDIKDPKVFLFMKKMSMALYRAKNWSCDYDGVGEVLGFFW